MDRVKILHTADIHIGAAESFLGAAAEQRRYETLLTFERILDLAVKNEVRLIALAGDIFDSNDIEGRFFEAVFAKIAALPQIKVVYAAGNHDPLNSQSPFINRPIPENLYVLGVKDDCITFDDLKLRVYGRSFENISLQGEENFGITPENDGYINLMVQHGELKSNLNSDYNAITPAFVKKCGMDYIALGHIHERSEIGRIGDTFFAYCGCPEGHGFDELGEKGVYIGEIGKGICDLKFVPAAKRMHLHETVNIEGLKDSVEITARVSEGLKAKYGEAYTDNLYKIELTGEIPLDAEILTAEIESRLGELVYYAKVKDSTEYTADFGALAEETSLKGIFVKKMLEKIDSASPEERELYKKALKLGLKAFVSEVKYLED